MRLNLYRSYFKILFFIFVISISSCTTKKNTAITRAYHNLTAHYNVYFNGNESLKNGLHKIDKNYNDDYSTILPIYKYTTKRAAQMLTSDMDRTIQKSAKLIKSHSITVKPKVDKKKKLSKSEKEFLNKLEYCKWIDDGYFIMGKAHYFKKEYFTAEQTFLMIINRYKNNPIHLDAKLWLAKTKIESGDYEGAESLLKELKKSSKTSKELLHEVNLTYADMYIKQKIWHGAAKYLEKSVAEEKNKKFRFRLHFILGQIYQQEEKYTKAEAHFLQVIKKNNDYEMTFNAKIRLAEISEKTNSNKNKLKKSLQKMLKDDKNIDYLDQIYYALGRIELNEANLLKAIEYFNKAVAAKTSNKKVKAKAYLVLADYYADKNNYKLAQAYYDSTVASINQNFSDYESLYPKVSNKADLMKQLNTISIQDSLQFIAKLPEKERNKIIDKQIKQVIAKEKEAQINKNNGSNFDPFFDNQNNSQPRVKGGKWYFYNAQAVSYGVTDFKRKWGDRELDDLWRLSNKKMVSNIKPTKQVLDTTATNESKNAKKKLNPKTREYYLADLPLSAEKVEASNKKIENALFNAAMIYADKIQDNDKAISTMENFLQRFPETNKRLDALQTIYNVSKRKGDSNRENKYKQMIIKEFPESMNAKILIDPNYLSKLQKEGKKAESLYEDAYNYYKAKRYTQAIEICNNALISFPKDELAVNFMFVKARAYGEMGNKTKLKENLNALVLKYPNTEIAKNAQEILAIMKSGKLDKKLYTFQAQVPHYLLIIAPAKKMDFNRLKFDFLSFNLDNFDDKNLQVSTVKLDEERNMIVIQTFKNVDDIMKYNETLRQKNVLAAYKLIPHTNLIISKANYEKFLKDQNTQKYLAFYRENYK